MPTVDYRFYAETYGGGLSEAAFASSLPAAVRHVRWLTNGRSVPRCALTAYKRAICAATDAFAEYGEGQLGGFRIGEFSVTNYKNEGTTGEDVATEAACKELVGTGLAFSGVR